LRIFENISDAYFDGTASISRFVAQQAEFFFVSADSDDSCTVVGEKQRGGATDAAARAGDNGNFIVHNTFVLKGKSSLTK
jgi:hypothetical protein